MTVKERLPHDDGPTSPAPPATGCAAGSAPRRCTASTPATWCRRCTPAIGVRRCCSSRAGRATIDRDLSWVSGHGTAEVGDVLVVETKSGTARPGPLDRRLWGLGHRPVRISKYGTGLALLTPDLPAQPLAPGDLAPPADHLTLREGDLA